MHKATFAMIPACAVLLAIVSCSLVPDSETRNQRTSRVKIEPSTSADTTTVEIRRGQVTEASIGDVTVSLPIDAVPEDGFLTIKRVSVSDLDDEERLVLGGGDDAVEVTVVNGTTGNPFLRSQMTHPVSYSDRVNTPANFASISIPYVAAATDGGTPVGNVITHEDLTFEALGGAITLVRAKINEPSFIVRVNTETDIAPTPTPAATAAPAPTPAPGVPNLGDQSNLTFAQGYALVPVVFVNTGASVTTCSVIPALPSGLQVTANSGTCVITGIPTSLAASQQYTFTAVSTGGESDTAMATIAVSAANPPQFQPTFVSAVRNAETHLDLGNIGSPAVGCSIDPALPTGLTIRVNGTGCLIAGTATTTSTRTTYTMTGRAQDNSTHAVAVDLSVIPVAGSAQTQVDLPRRSSQRMTFYDTVHNKHWAIYNDGTSLKSSYSADGAVWTAATNLGFAVDDYSVTYKSGHVLIAWTAAGQFEVALYSGTVGATSISQVGNFTTPLTGSGINDTYRRPTISTDDSNIWIGASYYNSKGWQMKVAESTTPITDGLHMWSTPWTLGSLTASPKEAVLLPKGGTYMYLIYQDGDAITGFTYDGANWSAANSGTDLGWFTINSPASAYSTATAMAVSGPYLYVGGDFSMIHGVAHTSKIARWDGVSWQPLGIGVDGNVQAIKVVGSDVYVGGFFTAAGGVAGTARIARWDGAKWNSVGGGIDNAWVSAIEHDGNYLYVGGFFTDVDNNAALDYLVKWDGNSWSALGDGVAGGVYALAVSGSDLFVGGIFLSAGGVSGTACIAKWSNNAWAALGTGTNGPVAALKVAGIYLYAAGYFSAAGGVANTAGIARWSAGTWSALGTGTNDFVTEIEAIGTDIYIGGNFTSAGGVANTSRIAKWNGSAWSALGTGADNRVESLVAIGSTLYAGGNITSFGGVHPTWGLARWTGSVWQALDPSGINYSVNVVKISGNELYVGGGFSNAGGVANTSGIAKWTGSEWAAVGAGCNSCYIFAIAINGTDVYVGGNFISISSVSANSIAKWNGTTWSALGSGTTGQVHALEVFGGDLYVGGEFTSAGGVANTAYFAKWNGTAWSGFAAGPNDYVEAIATYGSNICIGGKFSNIGGNTAMSGVACWGGFSWLALGTGANVASGTASVYSLAVAGTSLYAAGSATSFGGVANTGKIAEWNGSAWRAMGQGVGGTVNRAVAIGSNIYACGNFPHASNVPNTKNIAMWNGSQWTSVAAGMNSHCIGADSNGTTASFSFQSSIFSLKPAIVSNVSGFSASVDYADQLQLLYAEHAGPVKLRTFNTQGSWLPATTVADSGKDPVVATDRDTGDAFALWNEAGILRYKWL